MHRFERPDEDDRSVEFHLGCGDWIRLLHASGLEVEALIELGRPRVRAIRPACPSPRSGRAAGRPKRSGRPV